MSHLRANLWLLGLTLVLCTVLYPAALLGLSALPGFRDKAEGSLIRDSKGQVIGSHLIAQPFTKDYYFQPRPSAASYNASASAATNWGGNNYLLRDRVARQLGPIVRYGNEAAKLGKSPGQLVGPDIDAWFQKDRFQKQPGIVAQWAGAHSGLAEAWIKATGDAVKGQWKKNDKEPEPGESFLNQWREDYPSLFKNWMESPAYADWKKQNPDAAAPKSGDLAKPFFEAFAAAFPGYWPIVEDYETPAKEKRKKIGRVKEASDSQTEIQSVFFDMWRQDHSDVDLEAVPADMVMASGSGLDPHITLKNARYQLKYRVAEAQAKKWIDDQIDKLTESRVEGAERKQRADAVRQLFEAELGKRLETAIEEIVSRLLDEQATAPLGGLVGVPFVNVLELNLAMDERIGRLLSAR